jgi:SAM-dependent methyltransferase
MSRHYDQDYHRSIAQGGETNPVERWQWAQQLIERHCQGGSILDIGCSSGAFLKTMQGPRWKLYGIDMEASTAERAQAATGAEVFVGDAMDAPFPRESFDVITSFDLIEHVYNPPQLMERVGEWLKNGGLFVGQIPNIDAWEARLFGSYWYGLELPRHLFHFSPQSIRHLMKVSGLDEVSLTTAGNTYAEASLVYLYLRSRERLGLRVIPPAEPRSYGIAFRAVRKAFRTTMLKAGGEIAAAAGAGPSMIAIFRKTRKA